MQTPKVLLEFVRWRWAPTVGLSLGAVAYVVVAVAVIPEQIGAPAAGEPAELRAASFAARIGAPATPGEEAPAPVADVTPALPAIEPRHTTTSLDLPARRGFSPPLERPEPPPPAVAPMMPPPMPTPEPPPAMPQPVDATAAGVPTFTPVPPDIASLPQSDPNAPPPPEIPPPAPAPMPGQ